MKIESSNYGNNGQYSEADRSF